MTTKISDSSTPSFTGSINKQSKRQKNNERTTYSPQMKDLNPQTDSNARIIRAKPTKGEPKIKHTAKLLYPKSHQAELNLKDVKSPSSRFRTHPSGGWEVYHKIVKTILIPSRLTLESFSRVVQPLPGEDKECKWKDPAIRISSLIGGIILTPFAIVFGLLGKTMELASHTSRPLISYIDNSKEAADTIKKNPSLNQDTPLHIRTHNLGFVINSMSNVGDLRPPKVRAKEVAASINNDPFPPDIICFQEAFNEGATRTLCEGIKKQYPYIIYNIAPQIGGFPSGQMIASKYPIEKIEYERLGGMIGVEKMAPRGIVTLSLSTDSGPLKIYSVHTAPLLGHDRAQARLKQLEQIQKKMEGDLKAESKLNQVLVGDFNTSRLSAWGEDNVIPDNQAEKPVLDRVIKDYEDLFLLDHDEKTGDRTQGVPLFHDADDKRMGGKKRLEASGSWYVGPFHKKGLIMNSNQKKDKKAHHYARPEQVINNPKKATWGTSAWNDEQLANTARFDLVLVPKGSELTGHVEIRRVIAPKDAQSAPTDHLPVDALLFKKKSEVIEKTIEPKKKTYVKKKRSKS